MVLSEKMKSSNYWFPAKKYGWGWGPPNCWQGWTVFVVWLAAFITGAIFLARQPMIFIPFAVALAIVLFVICLLKGEKPRWRWGKD
jgi:hypothetical protein